MREGVDSAMLDEVTTELNATTEPPNGLLVHVHFMENGRARVVDVAPDTLTIEATGTADKLEALLRDLEPFGIKEMVQSGVVAIGRGSRSITAPVLRAAS